MAKLNPEKLNTRNARRKGRRLHGCVYCHKESITLLESDNPLEDSLYIQSRHSGGQPHPNSKPIIEILREWVASGRVTVDEIVKHLHEKR